jgi:hypothetical protein
MEKLRVGISANKAPLASSFVLVPWCSVGRFSCSSDVLPRRKDKEDMLETSFLVSASISSSAVLLLFCLLGRLCWRGRRGKKGGGNYI